MSEYAVGVTAPPFHPWCRCTTAPYFADMEGVGERYARDAKTGESFTVPSDMTYEQWKEMQDAKYGAGTVDKMRKMGYNEKADREQWSEYCKSLGRNAPKSFKEFREIKYSDDWESYKAYARSIQSGELTPLADFELYKDIDSEIDRVLVGQTTSDRVKITGKSQHFISRVIGSIEQRRNGVPIKIAGEALRNPMEIRSLARSAQYVLKGECSVSVNPQTGLLIQVNPLHSLKKELP